MKVSANWDYTVNFSGEFEVPEGVEPEEYIWNHIPLDPGTIAWETMDGLEVHEPYNLLIEEDSI